MALQLTYTSKYDTTPVQAAYAVIQGGRLNGIAFSGQVAVYQSEGAYATKKQPIDFIPFTIADITKLPQGANLIAGVYTYLLTLPTFKGAIQVA